MTTTPSHDEIEKTLDLDPAASRKATARRLVVWTMLAVVAAASGWYVYSAREAANAPAYITAEATRGDLDVRVTATGTLEPTNEVEISSELSGIVREVLVDHNDPVRKGQVLARLDSDVLEAEVARARALLAAAKAQVQQSQATLNEAKRDFERYEKLLAQNATSQQTFEKAKAVYERAQATLTSARADVAVTEADLKLQETNLRKASINSPVDGIVLTRSVDPGQTVAASFQAPTLFTLAEDFTSMELRVDVDEADVGLVTRGQSATFTVDAYPASSFNATLTKLRFAPEEIEGVVTYKAHLLVDNRDLRLRPGMTATAEISVRHVQDAVLIPNAALRFTLPADQAEAGSGGLFSRLIPHRRRTTSPRDKTDTQQQRVWILQDGAPVAVPVFVGLSDGRMTELTAGDITPGTPLLTGLRDTP